MSSNNHLNAISRFVHEDHPNILDTQVLNTLLPSLFLALVARDTNIILSTPQPAELQKATTKILSLVFGLQTKRVKVRGPQTKHELLETLFLSMTTSSSSSSVYKRKPSNNLSRSVSAPRPPSSHFTEGSDSTAPPPSTSRFHRHKTDPLPRNSDPQPSWRLPQVVVFTSLERAGRAAQLALAEVLRTRRFALNNVVWNLPDGFFVICVSLVGDGYERPSLHNSLLDHFAFGITLPHMIVPPPPSSPSPKIKPLLLPAPARKPSFLPYDHIPHPDKTHISPLVSNYINALLTATRHHPELDGTLLTARCVKDVEKLVNASSIVFQEDGQTMITEMHVRRVIPPILAHRLRVRDSAREQILGLLYEGAGIRNWGKPAEVTQPRRRTVKAILADILKEI